MPRCPITYERCDGRYSAAGLRRLAYRLQALEPLPFTSAGLRREAAARADKMSIQGVQPKLSAQLSVAKGRFEIVDRGGTYILKPQIDTYAHVPENEDLTMRLAATCGIEVPLHGLIYAEGGELCYFIKRFDRTGRRGKVPVEDFAQLLGARRDTKYDSSMERVAKVVDRYCTFPAKEQVKLFRRVLVAFLTGNEDLHLKNFSLITREGLTELAPAYDFLNSTLALRNPTEELALPLRGKRSRITRSDLMEYFARERLGLTEGAAQLALRDIADALPTWPDLIRRSFLPEAQKQEYLEILSERRNRLGL